MTEKTSLHQLEQQDIFIRRHIGPSEQEQAQMCQTLGVDSVEELISQTVPENHSSRERFRPR